jgi:dihydroorotate dehydrogenase electron transfer subunit
MRLFTAHVQENHDLGGGFTWLRLDRCAPLADSRPGQFVMVRGGAWERDPLLPRAYSVLWADGDQAELLIHTVGRGSALLAHTRVGETLQLLGPLGSSFPDPDPDPGSHDLLVAGGCGLAPLHFAARRAIAADRAAQLELLLGARTAAGLVLLEPLRRARLTLHLATEDGSHGDRGLVTDALRRRLGGRRPSRILACGPQPMLLAVRALAREHHVACHVSVEAPMACGVGACLGCAVPGRSVPYHYVCHEGPVFDAEEVWP